MRGLMEQEGLPYGKRTHTYNSRLAQEIGAWADTQEGGEVMHDALYKAYFVETKNIGDPDVLLEIIEANGLSVEDTPHLRDGIVGLIKIVEGFYACGVAASVYGFADPAGSFQPDGVFANVGKLMLATQIYDMHRIAHEVSGGLIVALPGPDEDHNPETAGDLAAMLQTRPDIPHQRRADVARLMEDLTASKAGTWMSVISLHGGGSPAAMKREIYRYYPIEERKELVEKLLDRGVVAEDGKRVSKQPGRCCPVGCQVPETPQLDYKSDDTPKLGKLDPAAE